MNNSDRVCIAYLFYVIVFLELAAPRGIFLLICEKENMGLRPEDEVLRNQIVEAMGGEEWDLTNRGTYHLIYLDGAHRRAMAIQMGCALNPNSCNPSALATVLAKYFLMVPLT